MAALNANAYYRENQVTMASRGQLLLMVYDGMLRFLAEGKRAMGDKRYEVQSTNITRAQALLVELISTLDHSANPELATNLDNLYRYMYDRLTHANVRDDERALAEVNGLLMELRGAWAEADRQTRCQDAPSPRGGGHAA